MNDFNNSYTDLEVSRITHKIRRGCLISPKLRQEEKISIFSPLALVIFIEVELDKDVAGLCFKGQI